jgi:hypothetical protein
MTSPKKLFQYLEFREEAGPELEIRHKNLRETAIALRNQRMHDIRRTGFAVFLYILQVVAVFVPAVGGSASPSGGKVSPAMMLVWLLPIVLLSNAIGDYACWKASRNTLLEFLATAGIHLEELDTKKKTDMEASHNRKCIPFVSELEGSGAVIHSRHWSARRSGLAFVSALPVTLACATAFAVDYTAPTWFSCRAILIIGSYALWLISAFATLLMRLLLEKHCRLWLLILVKDITIATPIIVLILLSSCGYFNSCYCSSGAIVRGGRAQVVLHPDAYYPLNNHVIYPACVSIVLGLQLLIPIIVRYVHPQGFNTMWWSDCERPSSAPEIRCKLSTKSEAGIQTNK